MEKAIKTSQIQKNIKLKFKMKETFKGSGIMKINFLGQVFRHNVLIMDVFKGKHFRQVQIGENASIPGVDQMWLMMEVQGMMV